MSDLTHEILLTTLDYDPISGLFRRVLKPRKGRGKVGDIVGSSVKGAYWRIGIGSKTYRAHRLAWFYMTGSWPVEEIDHRDGDGFNNSWSNLRSATTITNKWNMKKPITNTSGYKGVCYNKSRRKWQAMIRHGGPRPKYIGIFATPEEAHEAWKRAAIELHGDFARHA